MAIRHLAYFFMAAVIFLPFVASAQSVIYVNHAAAGADNGTSWTDAYTFLQDALQAAQSGDEVWVSQGIYMPDQGTGIAAGDREASFEIPSGVSLYGGFSGTETARDQRDWEVNETVLSGDLLGNDNGSTDPFSAEKSDNSHRIVYIVVPESERVPILDGFTISNGNATADGFKKGAGLYLAVESHVRLSHIVFTGSFSCVAGGAMYSLGTFWLSQSRFEHNNVGLDISGCRGYSGGALFHYPHSSIDEELPTAQIDDVNFISNTTTGEGGALGVNGGPLIVSNTTFTNNQGLAAGAAYHVSVPNESPVHYFNVRFIDNTATWYEGGAISVDDAAVRIINCLFNANKVLSSQSPAQDGGAISVYHYSSVHIFNSTFVDNYARTGKAIWRSSSGAEGSIQIWNSIFWNNVETSDHLFKNDSPYGIEIGNTIIEGGTTAEITAVGSIFDSDPLYADPNGADLLPRTPDDNFRLIGSSPAIDAGMTSVLPADVFDYDRDGDYGEYFPVDLDGNMRIYDGGTGGENPEVDLGPFEYDAPPVIIANEYVQELPLDSPRLQGNYPNPFNPTTTITYALPGPSEIRLEVFDLLGKRVRLLDSGFRPSGEYEVTFDATDLPSGVFFYTLTARDFSQTRKMVVVR